MKKQLIAGMFSLIAVTAFAAEKPFSIKVENLDHGRLQNKQVNSEAYGSGCRGENLSPAISWQNAPKGTKSFVVTVYDKDAPTGVGWMHWVVANIPATTTHLPEGVLADGTNLPQGALQTRTDFGVPGYGGACPPPGQNHRYEIKVSALGIDKLPNKVTADSMPALVGFLTKANTLAEASVIAEYQR